jgi:hypothetical protein
MANVLMTAIVWEVARSLHVAAIEPHLLVITWREVVVLLHVLFVCRALSFVVPYSDSLPERLWILLAERIADDWIQSACESAVERE